MCVIYLLCVVLLFYLINLLIFKLRLSFFWLTTRDSQTLCCIFIHKVLLKFFLLLLHRFWNVESLCHVGLSGLGSEVGLDEPERRQVRMISLWLTNTLLICFPPFFHKRFFSQVASLFLLPLPLPPSRPALLLRRFEGRKSALSAPAAERASEQVRSSTPLHRFLSSLFLSSASRPDSSRVFSFSVALTVVTAMDLKTSLAVSLVLLLLVVPTHAGKWIFWSRTF